MCLSLPSFWKIDGGQDAELIEDIHLAYPDVPVQSGDDLMKYLIRINATNNQPFIFIIDEWDAIKRKEYPAKIAEYAGDILLVGINYDKQSKTHSCRIERWSL